MTRTFAPAVIILTSLIACNDAPLAGEVGIAPADPFATDPLQLVIETDFVDPDGDEINYSILWTRNGEAVADFDDARTIPAAATVKGDTWVVQVVPDDGRVIGPAATAEVTIRNAPPRIDAVTLTPSDPTVLDDIRVEVQASDPDGDTTSVVLAWEIDGVAVPGETGPRLSAGRAVRGQEVVAIASVDDGSLPGGDVRSEPVTVQNTPPTVQRATISPSGVLTIRDTLSCLGTGWDDPDLDTPAYRYEWLVDGTSVSTAEQLSGVFSGGETVQCRLIPFDGLEEGPAVLSEEVQITVDGTVECDPEATMPAEPYSGEPFIPSQGLVAGTVAYDADEGVFRDWCSPDGEVPLAITLTLYDDRYGATGDLRYVCSVRLRPTAETVPGASTTYSFDFGAGSSRSYTQYGFTLEAGTFVVEDRRFSAAGGTVGGCLVRDLDTTTWGSDLAALIEAQDWGLSFGPDIAPEVLEEIRDQDTSDPEDRYSLYESGYLFGGGNLASAEVGRGPLHVAQAFERDPLDWSPQADSDGELVRIPASTAVPRGSRLATGIYVLDSIYVWRAEPLLSP